MIVQVPTVIIDLNVMTKIAKQVWPWELPVIEAKFDESKVRVQDVTEVEISELPDAREEFQRLAGCHGRDRGDVGTNLSFVEIAYGQGKPGITAFEKALRGEKEKPRKAKAAPKKKKVAAKKAKAKTVSESDPLA
jgi:hypothetical protein